VRPHHAEAIRRLGEHFSQQEGYLAVLVGGSIAKGVESEFSDIDALIIVTDELYQRLGGLDSLGYFSTQFCDYPGGYVDGKVHDKAYLRAAAERGNEPTRAAFEDAIVAFCADPEVGELTKLIPVYQEQEQAEKIRSFWAQFEAAYWYLGEALRRGDRYLLMHSVSDLVLYGGRLILAHNKILFPYHKLFMNALDRAPEKPERLLELIGALIDDPREETARALHDAIGGFRHWNEPPEPWNVRFMRDTELAWLDRAPYIGDR
jgi:predicted nucleotidyltransferase